MPKALDPSKRADARRLRAGGLSLNAIAAELDIGYSTVHRFTKGVRPDLERSSEDRKKIAAPKREAHEDWLRTAPKGECWTPGCKRPGCPIPFGMCHCGCEDTAPIADQDDRDRIYVRELPRRYANGRRMGDSLMAAGGGQPLLEALERTGLTRVEASRRARLSKGAVADLVGIKGHRRRRESCARIVAVLRAASEERGLDAADVTLEHLFTEERPADEPAPGERRRRVARSRPPIPPNERGDGRHFKTGVEQARQEAEAAGLWLQEQALEFLLLSRPAFITMERHDRISGRRHKVGAAVVKLYDPRDVKQLGLDLRNSDAAWDRRRLDPQATYTFARLLGVSRAEASRRAELAVERRRVLNRIRLGTGRPTSPGPPAYHLEWLEMFERIAAKLRAGFEAYHVPGDPPPTRWEVAALVADKDYRAHPERWEYAPEVNPRAARDRVWHAVKALQIAQSETHF